MTAIRRFGAAVRMAVLLSAVLVMATGCAHLLHYPVSQDRVQAHLDQRLDPLRDLRLEGPLAAFDFSVKAADVLLGPEEAPDRVDLVIVGEADVDLRLRQEAFGVQLRVRGLPEYDADEGAVYIRQLELVDSRVASRWFEGEVTEWMQPVVRAVAEHLDRAPVYEIEKDSATGRLAARVPASVRVEPERLILEPR